jgi:hypothetical protein
MGMVGPVPGTKPTPCALGRRTRSGEPERVAKALGIGRLYLTVLLRREGSNVMPYMTLAIHQLATLTPPETHRTPGQPLRGRLAAHGDAVPRGVTSRNCPCKSAALRAFIAAPEVVPPIDNSR